MNTSVIRALILLGFVYSLSACTFHSSQLEILSKVYAVEPKTSYQWLARYGNDARGVVPVDKDGLIVFANGNGDAVAFDGWNIRSVTGFFIPRPLIMQWVDGVMQYKFGSRITGHNCTRWYASEPPHEGWWQDCKADFSYRNVITLDSLGGIIEISQVVAPDGTRLTLTKQ